MSTPRLRTQWIQIPAARPAATMRLFCIPFAGGSSAIFRNWEQGLPPYVELCLVQLPGRGDHLPAKPYDHLSELLPALEREMMPSLNKPYALFGHSMGALICYELAQSLQQQGYTPAHLFVSAHGAPHLPAQRQPLAHLPADQFITSLRRLGGTPEAILVDEEMMAYFLPTLRADFALVESYLYSARGPLACPISVFGGIADDAVSRQALSAWQAHTEQRFRLRMMPGDHFFLLQDSQPLLLQAITADLPGFNAQIHRSEQP